MRPGAALGTLVVLAAALGGCRIDSGPQPAGRPTPPPASDSAPAPKADDELSQAEPATAAVPVGRRDSPAAADRIVYHVVKGARFFDILVARIGNREHIVIGETDDMCLDLPDQRDFDGDGRRDALVFRSPRCRGDSAPGLLFFVSADTTFRLSNPFPGHRPRVERWNGEWSVVTGEARHVLRDGRAVPVE